MRMRSEITGRCFENEDMVHFKNPLQSAFYVFHGATLYHIEVDDKMHFTFVFSKVDHERLKMLWKDSNIEKDKVRNNDSERRETI